MISTQLDKFETIFIDTAPIIYFLEAHSIYGDISKTIVDYFQNKKLIAYSSVITITEVLPKPIAANKIKLAEKYIMFLKYGRNFTIIDINSDIAERAGRLRGKYKFLKTLDAIQIAASISLNTDAFITNDKKLKVIEDINILILDDYK